MRTTLLLLLSAFPLFQDVAAQQPLARREARPEADPGTPVPVPPAFRARPAASPLPQPDEPNFVPLEEVRNAEGMVSGTRPRGSPYLLAFTGGSFEPQPGIDVRLLERQAADPTGSTYAFVMFQGRMTAERMRALERLGVTTLGPHTWQCVKARIPLQALQAIARQSFVRWVGYSQIEQKLEPRLVADLAGAPAGQLHEVVVNLFESDLGAAPRLESIGDHSETIHTLSLPVDRWIPSGQAQAALRSLGCEVLFYDHYTDSYRVRATTAQVETLLRWDSVLYVELAPRHTVQHDHSMAMIGQDRVRGISNGFGVPIGVIDTGIDSTPFHQDLGSKYYLGFDTTGLGAFNDNHGHGTHVTGTVCGDGRVDGRYQGAAPGVGAWIDQRIYVGRYFDNTGAAVGDVGELYAALSRDNIPSRKPAAVNNSWGTCDPSGWRGTDQGSRQIDNVVFLTGQTYVFSAGNFDSSRPSCANFWTRSPGCAKNVLTVGAATDWWDTTVSPGQRASFSCFGTLDGRMKPDVMAPGEFVTSCAINTSTGYWTTQGSSMAAPHVTGMLASHVQRDLALSYNAPALKAMTMAAAELRNAPGRIAEEGFGMVNSYRMAFQDDRTSMTTSWGVLNGNNTAYFFDLPMPADLDTVKAVLTWTEPAASAGAAQARVHDIRVAFDLPPYDPGPNTGEFHMAGSADNSLWHLSTVRTTGGLAAGARGQTVRIKVYGQSLLPGFDARWGLSLVSYRRAPFGDPVLDSSWSTTLVRPLGNLDVTATMLAAANRREFDNGRLWLGLPSGFAVSGIERRTVDGILHSYTSSSHPSAPFPDLLGGMCVGQGFQRNLTFHLLAPSASGLYTVQVAGSYRSTPVLLTPRTTSVCVDGLPPNDITGLRSLTHQTFVWSQLPDVDFAWNPASDVGCAGLQGLASSLYGNPTVIDLPANATSTRVIAVPSSAQSYTFRIRAFDNLGNGSNVASLGPYFIDYEDPVVNAMVVNNGNPLTTNIQVALRIDASDPHSGLLEMRHSMDGSTWSPWQTYTNASRTIDLSQHGGNTTPGEKIVHAQVRDRAGNSSTTATGTVAYWPCATLLTISPPTLPNVTERHLVLTGTNLDAVTRAVIYVGTAQRVVPITNTRDDWERGWIDLVSRTELHLYIPQALAPGQYGVWVEGPACSSGSRFFQVVSPTSPIVRTPSELTAGVQQVALVHKAGMSATTVSYLGISPSTLPTVLPGIVNLGIGAQFQSLIVSPGVGHDPATGVARFGPFPTQTSWVGTQFHFQAVLLDFGQPRLPLPTTDVWSTNYR